MAAFSREIGEGSKHFYINSYISYRIQSEMDKIIYLTDFKVKRIKSKITNIRSIAIIQVRNMNLNLNMKDINKIFAKAHFKCKIKKK
jgi:hypothetical protein